MPTVRDRIARAANTSAGWALFTRIGNIAGKLHRLWVFAERHRMTQSRADFYRRVRAKFTDMKVQHGPFMGLRYGAQEALGSTLVPKLLGSYESELHFWLNTVAEKDYGVVVDIGCAEGYYAVGLATLLPDARVFAYDIEPAARASCRKMAQRNGVTDRLTIGEFCNPTTLRSLDLTPRSLIISDCEGYELQLFDEETVAHLTQVDLVIECHDVFGAPITRTLIERFSDSHGVTIVETIPDHQKALELEYPELEGEPFPVRLYMVEERRLAPQNFLILEAKETR